MKTLLIVNVGQAPQAQLEKFGDFEQWALRAIRSQGVEQHDIHIEFHDGVQHALPNFDTLAGVIIMGSLAMASEKKPWMLRLSDEIVQLVERQIPLLGICFGHQLIAQALGGVVGYHPQGLEIGTVQIAKEPAANDDAIFAHLPEQFGAQAVHYQSVLTLPESAVHLARSDFEPHHAYRVGSACWGVQFHPEFTPEIMQMSLDGLKHEFEDDYPAKSAQVTETEQAKQVLLQFARVCCQAQ
ncbi:glutamine amidotransferase [Vibrio fluvialis]|uniref:glutamine amidotransferase n=1 Tax=Vibrio fluvialis TaxID=676 RepID=UPI000C21C377|nr:glutamine amidotransferase [Vibrio fluvialis]MBY7825931.1 glutamine amidotransferase [Vibrio fluvialis]MBY7885220.1 glutamine amidotransferase [Vibrio fluvialis]MBY7928146.1 glutamine amidotransferase [Vibrio fluvialis]MBY8009984.1 glutamine amidotransferase [Vibrio fluvialis]MBY8253702.1 glutamine amidotransferase [Vibrio fluvialis]